MQVILNGIISGSLIALFAVAFQTVYLPSRVFFIGLAGIYTLAPFIAQSALSHGLSWPVAAVGAVVSCICVSLLFEWLNHAPLARKGGSGGAHMISSLGLYMIIVQSVAMIWGHETRSLRTTLDAGHIVFGVSIFQSQWVSLAVSICLLSLFAGFLMHSGIGLRLRALADNPTQFALTGHNIDRHRGFAFALAGGFAAAASLATAYDIGFDPYVGLHALLLAVVAVMIGGRGTFFGPVLGALILGILRTQVVWHWPGQWQEAATFGLLGVFLLLRPQGVVGKKARLEAASS
jgi:branched-chain amino acid transport system permease protein